MSRKPKSKPPWSQGEYYTPGRAERLCFLEAIDAKAPAVLAELGAEPFRILSNRPDSPELRAALIEWAERNRINKPWVIEAAVRALKVGKDQRGKLLGWKGGLAAMGSAGGMIQFWHDPFNPAGSESPQEYKSRLRKKFDRHLQDCIAEARTQAENLGMRRASSGTPREWFEWLVLWQCCGKSEEEITRDLDAAYSKDGTGVQADPSTIRKGIRKAAEALGFLDILRPGTRGPQRRKRE